MDPYCSIFESSWTINACCLPLGTGPVLINPEMFLFIILFFFFARKSCQMLNQTLLHIDHIQELIESGM